MVIKLKIFKQKWVCPTQYSDECRWPENFKPEEQIAEEKFSSYVKMADWLDKNKKYKNRVMMVSPPRPRTLASIRKVVFDGVGTWVENRGNV